MFFSFFYIKRPINLAIIKLVSEATYIDNERNDAITELANFSILLLLKSLIKIKRDFQKIN